VVICVGSSLTCHVSLSSSGIGDLMTDAGLESPKQGELSSSIVPKKSPTHKKETAVL
jgi:hypothetical protein